MIELIKLYKTSKAIGQVLLIIFLLAIGGLQVVSAQPTLSSCTTSLTFPDDEDGVPEASDIDKNGNGLIEICDLEGLDAMRYVLNGSSYKADAMATTNTTGCPNNVCSGYELTRSLDFNEDASYSSTANRIIWTTEEGWQPIGDSSNAFSALFEGNDYTISNLIINKSLTDEVGLFGYTGRGAEIANLGLLNVNIIGASLVGSLVGSNLGSITNSYATGTVSGSDVNIGGLVGDNSGTIMSSYTTAIVSGDVRVGGLVGWNAFGGSITNSYATGSVSGDSFIGGLVGFNLQATIMRSYATATVSGDDDAGGLVGENEGTISYSYWLVGSASSGGHGVSMSAAQTAEELKLPTTATGIYSGWNTAIWDFGTSNQFPVLKTSDSNILLPGQGMGLRELKVLTSDVRLSPVFGASTTHYVITLFSATSTTSNIVLRLGAYNPNAEIAIFKQGDPNDYFADKRSGEESDPITVGEDTILTITVSNTETTSYKITFRLSKGIKIRAKVFLEGTLK